MEKLLQKYRPVRENLLDILHEVQENDPRHYLSDAALKAVASYLGMTPAEVKGTASFYSMFSFTPRGKYVIRVCDSPPCQLMGATSIVEKLAEILGISVGQTTEDGLFTLETTSCLGVCGVAPAMMINDRVYGNLTAERLAEVIDRVRRGNEAS